MYRLIGIRDQVSSWGCKYILLVMWILFPVLAIAQQGIAREYSHHQHLWMGVDFEQRFKKKYKLGIDTPYRRQSINKNDLKIYNHLQYYGFRFWATYIASDDVEISLSPYAYIYEIGPTHEREDLDHWEDEIRLTFRLRHAPEGSAVSHRYSVEKRYLKDYEYRRWREYRVRYRPQLNKEIMNGYSLIVNDEVFINMGKSIAYNIFDMNRFFIGLRKEIFSQIQVTAGYRNILEQQPSGEAFTIIHAVDLTLSIRSTLSD